MGREIHRSTLFAIGRSIKQPFERVRSTPDNQACGPDGRTHAISARISAEAGKPM